MVAICCLVDLGSEPGWGGLRVFPTTVSTFTGTKRSDWSKLPV